MSFINDAYMASLKDEVRDILDQKAFFPDEYASDYLLADSTNSEVKSALHLYNVITKGEM